MALSVCTDKVRIISPKCSDITTLKNLGYTIEYLEEPTQVDSTTSSFEPIQEEIIQEPIIEQIETVIIQEPEIQTLVIKQEDIFDNSLVLAETNATLKANNIELTNENNNLKSELENSITQLDLNKVILEHKIEKVHSDISISFESAKNHPRVEVRVQQVSQWKTNTKSKEIELEQYANSLGLEYTRRAKISGEPIYYTAPPVEEWVSYMPTTSATVREF